MIYSLFDNVQKKHLYVQRQVIWVSMISLNNIILYIFTLTAIHSHKMFNFIPFKMTFFIFIHCRIYTQNSISLSSYHHPLFNSQFGNIWPSFQSKRKLEDFISEMFGFLLKFTLPTSSSTDDPRKRSSWYSVDSHLPP